MTAPDIRPVTVPRQRGRQGRPPLTSPRDLLDAALRVGFDRLTVGKVTGRCNVKYSTFYRHYVSLDALVAAMVDEILDERAVVDIDSWRDQLEHTAAHLTTVCGAWPGMAAALAEIDRPDWITRARERCIDRMLAAGMPAALAERGTDAVLRAVTDPRGGGSDDVALMLDGIAARAWST